MKVSVIVPVYNSVRYVESCVERLLKQSYQNFEVILVDDGSEDGSGDVCDRMQQIHPQVRVLHKINQGLSSARNTGLHYVTGDYFCFLDCDDWLDRKYLKTCIGALAKNPVDILLTPYVYEYGKESKKVSLFKGNKPLWISSGRETSWVLRRLFGQIGDELRLPASIENYNPAWAKLYRTDLLSNLSFVDTKIIGSEDLWYNINAFYKAQSYCYINSVYYHYNRDNSSSITRSYRKGLADQYRNLYTMMAEFIKDHQLPKVYIEALNNRKVSNLIALSINYYSLKNPQSIKEQNKQMLKVLTDQGWTNALAEFNYEEVTFLYKLFFFFCKNRQVHLLGMITKTIMAVKALRQGRMHS